MHNSGKVTSSSVKIKSDSVIIVGHNYSKIYSIFLAV